MGTSPLDYFLLAALGCLGTVQIAAAYAGLKGLSFFRRPLAGYIFGTLVIAGAFCWFFTIANRSSPSEVEGGQQVGIFLAGAIAAYIITVAVSSLLKYRLSLQGTASRCREQTNPAEHTNPGIELLKETTLLGAIRSILKSKLEDR